MNENSKEIPMQTSINSNQMKNSHLLDEFDQEKFSMRDTHTGNQIYSTLNNLDDIMEIRKKISIQRETINEFESYLVMLLNVVEKSGGGGYTNQIRKVNL